MQNELKLISKWVLAIKPEIGVCFAGSSQNGIFHIYKCSELGNKDYELSNVPFSEIEKLCTHCVTNIRYLLSLVVDPIQRRMLESYNYIESIISNSEILTPVAEEISLQRRGDELESTMIIIDLAEQYDKIEIKIRECGVILGAGYDNMAGENVSEALAILEIQREKELHAPKTIEAFRDELTELYGLGKDSTDVICALNAAALKAGSQEAVARLKKEEAQKLSQNWQSREPAIQLLVSEALEAVFIKKLEGPLQVGIIPKWAHEAIILLCGKSAVSRAYLHLDSEVLSTATTLWLDSSNSYKRTIDQEIFNNFDACVRAAKLL
jgi:hypothetical protein